MILDYQETLMQQGFVFREPQATKSCAAAPRSPPERAVYCLAGRFLPEISPPTPPLAQHGSIPVTGQQLLRMKYD